MKALVIGFGKMGMLHASILNSLEGIEEVVLCESASFIKDGVQTLNPRLKVYSRYEEALEKEKPSLAVITTPNPAHFEIFKALAPKGLSIFVEKPFVTSFQEAKEAQKIFLQNQSSRQKIMVGYCLRFMPTFEKAKEAIEKGVLGKIFHFEATMYSSDVEKAQGGWRFEKSGAGGGVLLDLGCHLVDLVRYFFGKPTEISGYTRSWVSKNVEDFCHATLNYKDFTGTLEAGWSFPGIRKPMAEILILGEKGRIRVNHDVLEINSQAFSITELEKPVPFDLAGPFYTRQFVEFVDCVRKDTLNRNNLSESVVNHQILDAIKSSQGNVVSLVEEEKVFA